MSMSRIRHDTGLAGVAGEEALQEFRSRYLPRLEPQLAECERRLAAVTGRPGGVLSEANDMTLSAGGKRLRPVLVFLFAAAGDGIGDAHYAAAAAVEMVHMATLVHDDVLDAADLRRGQPTVLARYGAPVSTAAGDYLFAAAFETLAAAGSPEAVAMLARTSLELSRGELLQMGAAGDLTLTQHGYEERCLLKTSSLFATSCRLGALLAGAAPADVEAAGRYGRYLGLAFQIADDILDFSFDTEKTGKRFGTDLRDGTVTLPLIMALERDQGLARLLESSPGEEGVESICRRVRDSGALDQARRRALEYIRSAREALAGMSARTDRYPLELIAAATVDRSA